MYGLGGHRCRLGSGGWRAVVATDHGGLGRGRGGGELHLRADQDAAATLQQVVDRVNGLRPAPAFVLHTGDQTHGQKAGAFDTVAEILKTVKTERIFYVPGEHDVFLDGGKEYLARYGKGTVDGRGWQSFDYKGTHFVGLVNVLKYKGEGMGSLGDEQLEWLEKDVAPLSSSTPIVIFS